MGEEGRTGLWTCLSRRCLMSVPPESYVPSSLGGRSGQLDRCLSDLLSQAPELEAAAVVSFDGLAMASALPAGMDEDRVAAMSAALLSLGEKAAQGLGRGDLSQVYIEGEYGTVFLVSALDEAVLVAVATKAGKTGLMLYEVRRAAAVVGQILQQDGAYYGQAHGSHAHETQPEDDLEFREPSYVPDEQTYQAPEYQQAEAEVSVAETAETEAQVSEAVEADAAQVDHQPAPEESHQRADAYQPAEAHEPVAEQPEVAQVTQADSGRPFEQWSAPDQSAMVMTSAPGADTHEHYFQDLDQQQPSDQSDQPEESGKTGEDRPAEAEPVLQGTAPEPTAVWSPYSPHQHSSS